MSSHTVSKPTAFIIIAAVVFVSHFLFLQQFGLYEDDYFYTLPVLGWNWNDWWHHMGQAITHPVQARPLHDLIRQSLLFASIKIGGLQAAYLMSFAIISINGFLLYILVSRILSPTSAAAAALVFVLYPVDTSRQVLMHQTALLVGNSLLIASLLLFQKRQRVLGYIVAALGLLNYESFYLPFLAAPLLVPASALINNRRIVLHCTFFTAIIAATLVIRNALGESRASEVIESFGSIVGKVFTASLIGPAISFSNLFLRPIDALLHSSPYLMWVALVLAATTTWWLRSLGEYREEIIAKAHPFLIARVLVAGLIAWAISYAVAFRSDYYPPIMSIGRLTGVHTPGTVGAALVVAAMAESLLLIGNRLTKRLCSVAFAAAIGLCAAFAIHVQQSEYVAHWSRQVSFYKALVKNLYDLKEGEIVVLDSEGDDSVIPITPGFPRFGMVNYGPLAFSSFIRGPEEWKQAPRLAVIWNGCPTKLTSTGGLAIYTPPWQFSANAAAAEIPDFVPVLRPRSFVYIRARTGLVERVSDEVEIGGHRILPRPAENISSPTVRLTSTFIGLTAQEDASNWFTLLNARNYPR